MMRTIATMLALAAALLVGCSTVQPLAQVSPSLTTLPLPSGAAMVPSASGAAVESCDATASLRPSTAVGPAVEEIRRRGRLIAGVDQSTNLFSFRDPVSGELQGFSVDISREIARDLLGDPDKVDFRLVSEPERIRAVQDQAYLETCPTTSHDFVVRRVRRCTTGQTSARCVALCSRQPTWGRPVRSPSR